MRIGTSLLSLLPLALAGAAKAQAYEPYPDASVNEAQWQTYFDEVSGKHGSTRKDAALQRMVTFVNERTNTHYSFTKPDHPAHPSWLTRKFEEIDGHIAISQVGYFAGSEAEFARLFQKFSELNDRIKEELNRSQPTSGRKK
jgi:uncharacterized protein YdcH (DUF465 family)